MQKICFNLKITALYQYFINEPFFFYSTVVIYFNILLTMIHAIEIFVQNQVVVVVFFLNQAHMRQNNLGTPTLYNSNIHWMRLHKSRVIISALNYSTQNYSEVMFCRQALESYYFFINEPYCYTQTFHVQFIIGNNKIFLIFLMSQKNNCSHDNITPILENNHDYKG